MNIIKVAGIRTPLPIVQIMYILGRGNYSEVYTANGERILTSMTLSLIEKQSGDLVRIHKGTLINPDFIKKVSFDKSAKQRKLAPITMQDGMKLAVSRRRNEVLLLAKAVGKYS